MNENKCLLCPTGHIQTEHIGRDHLHDFCAGCSYKLCMATVPCGWRS